MFSDFFYSFCLFECLSNSCGVRPYTGFNSGKLSVQCAAVHNNIIPSIVVCALTELNNYACYISPVNYVRNDYRT